MQSAIQTITRYLGVILSYNVCTRRRKTLHVRMCIRTAPRFPNQSRVKMKSSRASSDQFPSLSFYCRFDTNFFVHPTGDLRLCSPHSKPQPQARLETGRYLRSTLLYSVVYLGRYVVPNYIVPHFYILARARCQSIRLGSCIPHAGNIFLGTPPRSIQDLPNQRDRGAKKA